MSDPTSKTTDDEFYGGIWWVPDGAGGGVRNATPGECAAEIKRLRALWSELEDRVNDLKMDILVQGERNDD